MPTTPSALALTTVVDGSQIVASDHRNNYAAVQTAMNALITILAGGASGQLLGSSGGTTIGWTSSGTTGTELDYAQTTSDVTGINGTTEGGATTLVTGSSVAYDATKKNIRVTAPDFVVTAGAPTKITLVVLRGATAIGQFKIGEGAGGGGGIFSGASYSFPDTPGAATFAYTLKAFVDTGTVTAKAGNGTAGNYLPMSLTVTKA